MHRKSRRLALAVALLAAPLRDSSAQDATKPWRLADALATPDWFQIRGSSRVRYATLDGQFRSGGSGGDQILSIQSLLDAGLHFDPFTITVEGVDSRQFARLQIVATVVKTVDAPAGCTTPSVARWPTFSSLMMPRPRGMKSDLTELSHPLRAPDPPLASPRTE